MLSKSSIFKAFDSEKVLKPVRERIVELLETDVRPALQADGGDISYVDFDEESGELIVEMTGSCAGCPYKTQTLKGSVERYMSYYIPEVKIVSDINDVDDVDIEDDLFDD